MMEVSDDDSVLVDEEEDVVVDDVGFDSMVEVVVGVSTAARRLECNDRYDVD